MAPEQLAVTISEAAAMTGVGRSTGYALAASGEWPTIKVGTRRLVPVAALREWVERGIRATDSERATANEVVHDRATTDAEHLAERVLNVDPDRTTENGGVSGRGSR